MAEIFKFDATEPNITDTAGQLGNVIGNDWDVVRNSIATYQPTPSTLTEVAAHVARIQDGKVLVEAEATNVCLDSEFFGRWLKISATVTDDTATAPDGSTTADTSSMTPNSGLVYKIISGVTAAEGYATFSYFVSSISGAGTFPSRFNGGTYDTKDAVSISEIWKRVYYTSQSSSGNFGVYCGDSRSIANTLDDGYVWGAQVEVGQSVSSYIPAGQFSEETRLADVITNTVPNTGTGTLTLTKIVDGVESSETVTAGQALTMENGTSSIIITDSPPTTTKKRNNGLLLIKKLRK